MTTSHPVTLLELAARSIRMNEVPYGPADLPRSLAEYLQSANCCVNPKCRGEIIRTVTQYYDGYSINIYFNRRLLR